MFKLPKAEMILLGLAGMAVAWWLFRENNHGRAKQTRRDKRFATNLVRRPQPMEYWLDDTIEASFPASDPSSSTPLLGAGRRND